MNKKMISLAVLFGSFVNTAAQADFKSMTVEEIRVLAADIQIKEEVRLNSFEEQLKANPALAGKGAAGRGLETISDILKNQRHNDTKFPTDSRLKFVRLMLENGFPKNEVIYKEDAEKKQVNLRLAHFIALSPGNFPPSAQLIELLKKSGVDLAAKAGSDKALEAGKGKTVKEIYEAKLAKIDKLKKQLTDDEENRKKKPEDRKTPPLSERDRVKLEEELKILEENKEGIQLAIAAIDVALKKDAPPTADKTTNAPATIQLTVSEFEKLQAQLARLESNQVVHAEQARAASNEVAGLKRDLRNRTLTASNLNARAARNLAKTDIPPRVAASRQVLVVEQPAETNSVDQVEVDLTDL